MTRPPRCGRARSRRHAAGPMRFAASSRSLRPSDSIVETHRRALTCRCPRWRRTWAGNLAPLCRTHHRAKTFTGWTNRRARDGSYHWTDPHGRTYTVGPDGTRATTPVTCPPRQRRLHARHLTGAVRRSRRPPPPVATTHGSARKNRRLDAQERTPRRAIRGTSANWFRDGNWRAVSTKRTSGPAVGLSRTSLRGRRTRPRGAASSSAPRRSG